jgi:16S rRNA (guanine527-N7)-methyltransferase
MTKEEFIIECKNIGIDIDDEIISKLDLYKNELIDWNKKFNLTTIIEEKDIYLKHFYDSLCLIKAIDLNNKNICDFGVGAGFPGMVLAIVFNNSSFTLIESNSKKVSFLENIREKLKLNNVNIINTRTEEYGKNNREIFDIVTCRAVSNLKIILELSISMLKINGLFIPMKSNVEDEFNESIEKSKLLGYDFINKIEYKLPIENSNRTLLIYKKITKTNLKYPRNYNIIKRD